MLLIHKSYRGLIDVINLRIGLKNVLNLKMYE